MTVTPTSLTRAAVTASALASARAGHAIAR